MFAEVPLWNHVNSPNWNHILICPLATVGQYARIRVDQGEKLNYFIGITSAVINRSLIVTQSRILTG